MFSAIGTARIRKAVCGEVCACEVAEKILIPGSFRESPYYAAIGRCLGCQIRRSAQNGETPSCLHIVRAVVGLISLWRGMADLAPVCRLAYQEWLDPSRNSSQP
jgi:hypothetical protein